MGGAKKERGGIGLKKTIDRLIADLQLPAIRKSEEEAARALVQQEVEEGLRLGLREGEIVSYSYLCDINMQHIS
jgi:hypothetical protein